MMKEYILDNQINELVRELDTLTDKVDLWVVKATRLRDRIPAGDRYVSQKQFVRKLARTVENSNDRLIRTLQMNADRRMTEGGTQE